MCVCVLRQVRLFFLLSWFHAVVTERLRYVPLGWSHKYEFSQADAQSAFDVIEEWVNKVSVAHDTLTDVHGAGLG
jgi:dynein heavy chain 1